MTLRLSHRALVPVVAFAVLGGVMSTFMLTRLPRPTDEAPKVIKPKYAGKAAAKKPTATPDRKRAATKPVTPAPAKKPVAKAAAPAKTTPKAVPEPAPRAVPVTKPVPAAPPKPAKPKGDPVGAGGLPLVVARALASNPVAVVALYDPRAAIDAIALAEARAGAAAANVAFVPVNVFSEAQSRPLMTLLGILENPSVLVYRRPSELFVRIDGFADRDTVAQAAANARP